MVHPVVIKKLRNWIQDNIQQYKHLQKNNRRCHRCGRVCRRLQVHHSHPFTFSVIKNKYLSKIKKKRFVFFDLINENEWKQFHSQYVTFKLLCVYCHNKKHDL